MFGLFSNRIYAQITRPKARRTGQLVVAQIRLEITPTVNHGPTHPQIELKGLDESAEGAELLIHNFVEFRFWVAETNWQKFPTLKPPFDFSTSAMIEILNGLVDADIRATPNVIAMGCIARVATLGRVVKQIPTGKKQAIEWRPGHGASGAEISIRYKAGSTWSPSKQIRPKKIILARWCRIQ